MARPSSWGIIHIFVASNAAYIVASTENCPEGNCEFEDDGKLLQVVKDLPTWEGKCPGPSCGAPGCPGFAKCPTEFPLPYKGSYPQSYDFVPGQHFPADFTWGLGTAAYQIEGAYNEDGRGASIWDTFSGANTVGMPGSVCKRHHCPVNSIMGVKGATGNVANDFYHKYKQDIAMMASMGLKSYRFSIAWPRIIPTGIHADGVNKKAIKFYHDVIDELVSNGIEPAITMYHWDLPQGLQDLEWDWQSSNMKPCDSAYKQGWFECEDGTQDKPVPSGFKSLVVKEFVNYAQVIFDEYGDKVKYWFTFNEAWTFTFLGSGGRGKAPNVQPWMDANIWPYVAGHNVILAHVKAAELFYEMQKAGTMPKANKLGMTNNQDWREPATEQPQDIAAAQYMVEGQLGWYCDPIFGVNGEHDYPSSMKMTLPYMPEFSKTEKKLLKKYRPDIFGLNHYGTGYAKFNCTGEGTAGSSCTNEDGLAQAVSVWLYQAGWGFRKILNWVANRYGRDTVIWGTESGWSDNTISALQAKYDTGRLMYYFAYIQEMYNAITVDGVNMQGFMAWSLMDNYEWERGYAERFGVLWNDFRYGEDPNSPTESTPIYDAFKGSVNGACGNQCSPAFVGKPNPEGAYNQTRHAKNSILWLQWVWETNSIAKQSRFLAASIGGDVCYGEGSYNGVQCALASRVPGPAPPKTWR